MAHPNLLPWQGHNAGKSRKRGGQGYTKHPDRLYRDGNSYYVRVPVPKDLRPKNDPRKHYRHNTVCKYLGTSNAAEAKRLAPAAIQAIRDEFEARRRGSADASTTMDTLRHVWSVFRKEAFDDLAEGARFEDTFGNADVLGLLKSMGVKLDQRDLGLAKFVAQYGQALAQERIDNRAGPPPEPRPWRRPAPSGEPISGFIVLAAYEKYAAVKNVKPETLAQTKTSVRLFVEHVGDTKLAIDVTPEDAVSFKDRLARINPEYRRAIRKGVTLTLADMEAKFAAPVGNGMSAETINRHLSNLRSVFDTARARGLPLTHPNPFAHTSEEKPKGKRRHPLTDAEIVLLLKGAPLVTKRAKSYKDSLGLVIAVAAYSGMRQGEILALTKDDVVTVDRLACMRITDGKTANAVRVVPLHPMIRARIVAYAAKVEKGPLFPAANFASRFSEYRKSCGVTREKVSFHSLRHSFISKLRNAGLSGDDIHVIVGHAGKAEPSLAQARYTELTMKRAASIVAKVSYTGVKLA